MTRRFVAQMVVVVIAGVLLGYVVEVGGQTALGAVLTVGSAIAVAVACYITARHQGVRQ